MAKSILSPASRQLIQTQLAREDRFRRDTLNACGSTAAFVQALQAETFDSSASPLLEPFYLLYERCFPLREEREPIEGFARVLDLNRDEQAQERYGPSHEFVTVAKREASPDIVAAANFIVMPYDRTSRDRYGFTGSCQLNFLCVAPEVRGVGIAQHMLDHVDAIVARKLTDVTAEARPAWFTTIEQNNPGRMTQEQIERDAAAALIDPAVRGQWWSKRGFRKLAFNYVQPPLSAEHDACTYIDFYAQLAGAAKSADALPAAALLEHLRRFFFISVGKLETDMEANDHWLSQKKRLEIMDEIGLEPAIF